MKCSLVFKMNLKNFLLLLTLSCCWGPSFLFIKLGLESFGPSNLVFLRLLFGGLILLTINYLKNRKLHEYLHCYKDFFLIGLFSNALPFIFITKGETYIPSSLAAVMNSTTPLFTAILAHLFLEDEKLKPHKIFGVLLGMLGIFIIFFPSLEKMVYTDLIGCSLILLAAFSYSISFVLAKKRPHTVPTSLFPAGQLLAASLITLPFGIQDLPSFKMISFHSYLALGCLSMVGTALAFIIYFKLIRSSGATFVSYSSLLFPIIGIFLGFVFLGETMTETVYIGSLFIFSGVILACFYHPIKEKLFLQKKASID